MNKENDKYQHHLSRYAVVYEASDGRIFGETEHSFNMGASSKLINVWQFDKEYKKKYGVANHLKIGKFSSPTTWKTDEGETVTIVRSYLIKISSPDCGFEIDFTPRIEMKRGKMKYDKFHWRNLPFKVVEKVPKTA